MVGLQSTHIATVRAEYQSTIESAKKMLDETALGGGLGKAAAYKRHANTLNKQTQARSAQLEALNEQRRVLMQKLGK
jgi:hypothetical protein